jgi:hypothetical protein
MSVLFTANTPWLLYCAQALRVSKFLKEPGHLLIVLKGDSPFFKEAIEKILLKELWDSVYIFEGKYLKNRFSQIVPKWKDLIIPLKGRSLIKKELQEISSIFDKIQPDFLILGNKWHAPETFLYYHAIDRQIEVGLYEEGLSIYQLGNYWEKGPFFSFINKCGYYYHGVEKYYGNAQKKFKCAWLSLPEIYPHSDVEEKVGLFKYIYGFEKVAKEIICNGHIEANLNLLDKNSPLILSQRLSEDGLVSKEEEREVLCKTIKYVLEFFPKVYLKMHPRDDPKKFDDLVKNIFLGKLEYFGFNEFPVEILLYRWRPPLILGFLSGTLVYSRKMFGVPAYSIIDLFSKKNPGLQIFSQVSKLCLKFDFRFLKEKKDYGFFS